MQETPCPLAAGAPLQQGPRVGGRVCRLLVETTGQLLAVKTIKCVEEAPVRCGDGLHEELVRLQGMHHPHLNAVLGHVRTQDSLHIYLEFAPLGCMATLLAEFGPLSEGHLRAALRGCLEGLQHLHTREPPVAHGNLKGSNVLLATGTGLGMFIKLTDYGCAGLDEAAEGGRVPDASLPWAAPELVQRRCAAGGGAAAERCRADLWSLACTALEMCTGERPWGDGAGLEAIREILEDADCQKRTPPVPRALPQMVQALVESGLRHEPTSRPGAAQLLWHPFFTADEN